MNNIAIFFITFSQLSFQTEDNAIVFVIVLHKMSVHFDFAVMFWDGIINVHLLVLVVSLFQTGRVVNGSPKYKHFLEVFDRWLLCVEDCANNYCVLDAEI